MFSFHSHDKNTITSATTFINTNNTNTHSNLLLLCCYLFVIQHHRSVSQCPLWPCTPSLPFHPAPNRVDFVGSSLNLAGLASNFSFSLTRNSPNFWTWHAVSASWLSTYHQSLTSPFEIYSSHCARVITGHLFIHLSWVLLAVPQFLNHPQVPATPCYLLFHQHTRCLHAFAHLCWLD